MGTVAAKDGGGGTAGARDGSSGRGTAGRFTATGGGGGDGGGDEASGMGAGEEAGGDGGGGGGIGVRRITTRGAPLSSDPDSFSAPERGESAPGSGGATGAASCRFNMASNTSEQCPQRTHPSEIFSWSGTTLNIVPQAGQRVVKLMTRLLQHAAPLRVHHQAEPRHDRDTSPRLKPVAPSSGSSRLPRR